MEKQQAQQFKTGDVVTWTSQAAGSHVTKTGLVVGVVAPRKRPDAIFEALKPKPAQKAARKKKKAVPAKVPSKKKAAKAVKKK